MNTPNTVLMDDARKALEGKWGIAILGFFLVGLLSGAPQVFPFLGFIAVIILGGPLAIGSAVFALSLSNREDAKIEQILEGFKNMETSIIAYLIVFIKVLLYSLLLIVPGVIKGISYSQTFFILAQDDDIGAMEAIEKSEEMMEGHKAKYFRLMLRFMGWAILCIFTLGIGFFFLAPYVQVSLANFHKDISGGFDLAPLYETDILDDDLV